MTDLAPRLDGYDHAGLPLMPVGFTDDLEDHLDLGGPHRISVLMSTATGHLHLAHDCSVFTTRDGEQVRLRTAPRFDQSTHTFISRTPLTVKPSIRCEWCDLRGFLTDNQWIDQSAV